MTNEWDTHVIAREISSPGNGFTYGFTTSLIRSIA
jgi:hypothetical protein